MKSPISDKQIRNAAIIVRQSMLSALENEEIIPHDFSENFQNSIQKLRKQEETHHILRHCIAAVMALVLGMTIFFSLNTEAHMAAIAWVKKVFPHQVAYWFTGEVSQALPEYTLTWIPDDMDCVYDEAFENGRSMIYTNPNDPHQGFTLSYGPMQEGSATFIFINDAEHSILPTTVNGMNGELYLSQSPDAAHCLIWFDETQKVTFDITSYLDSDVILHIAESVKLVDSTK